MLSLFSFLIITLPKDMVSNDEFEFFELDSRNI